MDDKTMREHLTSASKYSGSSVGIGFILAKILVFTYPNLAPIELEIGSLLTFVSNMVIVIFSKK